MGIRFTMYVENAKFCSTCHTPNHKSMHECTVAGLECIYMKINRLYTKMVLELSFLNYYLAPREQKCTVK